MSRLLEGLAFFSLVLSVPAYPETSAPRPAVRIYVYDYAGVSQGARKQAESVFTRVLNQAGIAVTMIHCTSGGKSHTPSDCGGPLDAADLVVRIIPGDRRDPKRKLGISVGTSMATVYYQWALAFAAKQPPSNRVGTGEILGYGAAHEIGHLLLPSMHHSSRGIMRAEWGVDELRLIWAASLNFTPDQARGMREEVMRRSKMAAAVEKTVEPLIRSATAPN